MRDAGEATQRSKRRRLQDMGLSVQVLGGAGGESSQDSLAPPVPLSRQDVENYRPSPDLDQFAVTEHDEGGESEEEAAGNDGEKEPSWSSTEPATSQELARLGRDRAVKAEAPEEGEAPEAEEAPRREGEASDATSLQLVKLEEGPRRGFAGGSEVSLHGSMIGLMGEMLQQMKEQNRQQADYMKNQAEFLNLFLQQLHAADRRVEKIRWFSYIGEVPRQCDVESVRS